MTHPPAHTIRAATINDATRVASLATQLGYPTTAAEMPARLAAISADADHLVLLAECDHDAIGWIHIYARKTLAREGDAEIGGLIVDESYRGRGIGRHLVEQALAWARDKGCHTVVVRSNVVREDTERFYVELGFAPMKRQTVFRQTLYPGEPKQKTQN